MTINLFVIANVKQLRTGGSFRILLPFFPIILGCWRPKFCNFEQFSQSGWVWHDFGGPWEFRVGVGVFEHPNPPSVPHCFWHTFRGNMKMGPIYFPETSVVITTSHYVITQESAVISYFEEEAWKLARVCLLGSQGDLGVRLTADLYLVKLSHGGTTPWLLGVIIRHKKSFYVLRPTVLVFSCLERWNWEDLLWGEITAVCRHGLWRRVCRPHLTVCTNHRLRQIAHLCLALTCWR